MVAQGDTSASGVEEVSTSWQRSANQHGVDPDSMEAPRILTSHEIKQLQEPLDELIVSAQEEIDRLYKLVREAGYTLLFCDTAGVAVEHRGDETDASRFKYWGTWLGGVWSERSKARMASVPASPKSGPSLFTEPSIFDRVIPA